MGAGKATLLLTVYPQANSGQVILETGRIRLHDTGKNLLANPEVRDAYLGG
ncbi:hypothetical protein [Marinobacter sp.]|uniref:hypothetical protein n=1 Tax=Marinobacter sp. TaxID=50741 RepID=UPI0039B464B7